MLSKVNDQDLSTDHASALVRGLLKARLTSDPTRRQAVLRHAASTGKRPTASLVALWAAAVAMQQAATAAAIGPGADDDPRFTAAAGHCGEAADEIQRFHPNIAQLADLPALAAQDGHLARVEATDHLLAAIAAAVHDFDVENPDLLPTDLLAAGSAAIWLGLAHHAISGRLP
jgi:hypothetical protein